MENRQYSSIAQIALRLPASVGKMPRWVTGESVLCIMGRVLPYVNRWVWFVPISQKLPIWTDAPIQPPDREASRRLDAPCVDYAVIAAERAMLRHVMFEPIIRYGLFHSSSAHAASSTSSIGISISTEAPNRPSMTALIVLLPVASSTLASRPLMT
jgi:hypothetical protein